MILTITINPTLDKSIIKDKLVPEYNAETRKVFSYPDDHCFTGALDAISIEMKKAFIIGRKELLSASMVSLLSSK